jgi:hypothetical protein
MDWDSHLMPPEHHERDIEFDFYTFFDDVEVFYHWDEGYLTDEQGKEVALDIHPHGSEIQAYIEQNLWGYGLPDEPREVVIDDLIAIFTVEIHKGVAVWQFYNARDISEDDGWGKTITPTANFVKRAYEQLGNPFISFYPQWKEFEKFEGVSGWGF